MNEPKRRSEEEEEDRLSELPDSVIFLILSFVPFIEVVRTTILSKRWRNLWTTTPFLNFDYDSWWTSRRCKYVGFESGFERWVNQFLFRWNGVRILELRVCSGFGHLLSNDIEMWVEFAIAKGVENLYLRKNLDRGEEEEEECWVPRCLFSCSSLKLLTIKSFNWRIHGIVQWNKLKKLKIAQGFDVTERLIRKILCGSPLLEVFELSFLDQGQNLNIRSNSLKELSIHKHLFVSKDFDSEYSSLASASELKIWTPNLETLLIKGIPFGKCGLINVPASTHVTIEFSGFFLNEYDSAIPEEDIIDFIEGRFDQILQAIQHVESVELVCGCIKVLGFMEQEKCIYSKVKSLAVLYRCHCYDAFIGPLKLFSQLSRLVLRYNYEPDDVEACDFPRFQAANIPNSFRLQLRTVDITWSKCCDDDDDDDDHNIVFPFIEFLLKYADKLEKMVFRVPIEETPQSSSNSLLLALEELVRMPRSSPTCTILTRRLRPRYE